MGLFDRDDAPLIAILFAILLALMVFLATTHVWDGSGSPSGVHRSGGVRSPQYLPGVTYASPLMIRFDNVDTVTGAQENVAIVKYCPLGVTAAAAVRCTSSASAEHPLEVQQHNINPLHKESSMANSTVTYEDAIQEARELLYEQVRDPENESNPEYTRGVVNLIAGLFGEKGILTSDRMVTVAKDIGVTL